MVVDGGGWWWVVARFIIILYYTQNKNCYIDETNLDASKFDCAFSKIRSQLKYQEQYTSSLLSREGKYFCSLKSFLIFVGFSHKLVSYK